MRIPTMFLWGEPGIGKSQAVRQLGKEIEKETGKKTHVIDVRLLLFNPIDLRGLPTTNADKTMSVWLKPEIFQMNPGKDVVNILFLDELSSAPQSVQAAAYQICLDRKIGEHALPDNCIVIAAGNRTTDKSIAFKMPKALANRLMHYNIVSDYESWRSWATRNKISEKVIAYLAFDKSRLCMEPESSDLAYCTPRSWEFVSMLLELADGNPEEVEEQIAACIGKDAALEFISFCKGELTMPSVDEIMRGVCKDSPQTFDELYALYSALVSKVQKDADYMMTEELDNICLYVIQYLPKDFTTAFMKDIKDTGGVNEKLMKCHSFQSWINANEDFD